jgi:hypothetical protein
MSFLCWKAHPFKPSPSGVVVPLHSARATYKISASTPPCLQEYQGLLQAQAERDALLLKTEAQSKHFKLVGQEELLELQVSQWVCALSG